MDCNHEKMTKEEFFLKKCLVLNQDLICIFSFSTLSQITYNGWLWCYCGEKIKEPEKKEVCLICKIPTLFANFENELSNNMFDVNFLNDYNLKLRCNLVQLFDDYKKSLFIFSPVHSLRTRLVHRGNMVCFPQ